nr:DNA-binding protein WhiA [Lachnospiraceae bacterium]
MRAILTIQEKAGLASLPRSLQDIARLRLANPDLPLKDLGALLDPPVGKSGVNHRLRKLVQIADELS